MADGIRRTLFFTECSENWQSYFPVDGFAVDMVDKTDAALEKLSTDHYDLIVLDERALGEGIYVLIIELERSYPLIPVFALTANKSLVYQKHLVDAGAEDVLLADAPKEALERSLELGLKRTIRSVDLSTRNAKLYEIMKLMEQLYMNTEPQALIESAINLFCSTFKLYGAAVVVLEPGMLSVYSGQAGAGHSGAVLQGFREPKQFDPFVRVVSTAVAEMFDDIAMDAYYTPLPHLPDAHSAIVMPLRQQSDTLGALAVFGTEQNPLTFDDLVIFDIVAAELAVALQNAFFHQAQRFDIRFSQTLLEAWEGFLSHNSEQEIALTLSAFVENLPKVEHALVWINHDPHNHEAQVFSASERETARQAFGKVLNAGVLDTTVQRLDQGPQVISQLGRSQNDPLLPLFRALRARQLVFVPLEDSTRYLGGIVASIADGSRFTLEDANLIKGLSHAAGQALERITLIESLTDKSGRLEAILRGITEGIFFVDDTGRIAYCNPQVTELTDVNPSGIIGKPPDVLLNMLSEKTNDPERTRAQFITAIRSLLNFPQTDKNFPIVELALRDSDQQVYVEFVALERYGSNNISWLGLVRTNDRVPLKHETASEAIDLLLHTTHATGVYLRKAISKFAENDERLSIRERKQLAGEIQKSASNLERLLEEYAKFYQLQLTEPTGNYEEVDLCVVIQDTIQTHFPNAAGRFVLKVDDYACCIEMDRSFVQLAMTRLLGLTLRRARPNEQVSIYISPHDQEVHLEITAINAPTFQYDDFAHGMPDGNGAHDPQDAWEEFYVYYALTQLYHCRVWAETLPDNRRLSIAFPSKRADSVTLLPRGTQSLVDGVDESTRAPMRAPEKVMVIRETSRLTKALSSQLESEGYEVFHYDSTEDAIRDVNLTRLDLIVLEGKLPDADSVSVCKQLRRHTEVPVAIVATSATEEQRVKALKAGADDYITEPISKEELVEKINVLFKRQQLADRAQQPLDFGDMRIDFARRKVFINHLPVVLTRIEYDLLRTLAVNAGQVLTHQQLLEKVWGPEYSSETQYLWVNISRLRKKLEPTSYIQNQQGIGYIFQQN